MIHKMKQQIHKAADVEITAGLGRISSIYSRPKSLPADPSLPSSHIIKTLKAQENTLLFAETIVKTGRICWVIQPKHGAQVVWSTLFPKPARLDAGSGIPGQSSWCRHALSQLSLASINPGRAPCTQHP